MRTDFRRRGAALLGAAALAVASTACGTDTVERSVAAALIDNAPGFAPATIVVDQEDTVLLKVGNGTDRVHGFTIEGYRRSTLVEPNQTKEVKFKATRGGTFKIYCQIHPAHQPVTLIVQ